MDEAAMSLYRFLWNDFCDWYVELAKPRLRLESEARGGAQNMLAFVLETTLRLLHPITPFITEEIWQALPQRRRGAGTICLAPYPEAHPEWEDSRAEAGMGLLIEAVRALRNMRAELGIAPSARMAGAVRSDDAEARTSLRASAGLAATLARLTELAVLETAPTGGHWVGTPIAGGAEVFVELGDALNSAKELERIDKELAAIDRELEKSGAKLGNASFVERARPDVVQQERDRMADWQSKHEKLHERRRLFE
jgi:valyl-tRNA synthetase